MFEQVFDLAEEVQRGDSHGAYVALMSLKLFLYPVVFKKAATGDYRFDWDDFLLNVGYKTIGDEKPSAHKFKPIAESQISCLDKLELTYVTTLESTLKELSELLELSDAEICVFSFFCFLHLEEDFRKITDAIGDLRRKDVVELLHYLLKIERKELRKVIHCNSKLNKIGLLKIEKRDYTLDGKVTLLEGVTELIDSGDFDLEDILGISFHKSNKAELSIEDFPHLKDEQIWITSYLQQNKGKGLNVLVYGEPGAGKTQWVKAISTVEESQLFEISSENEDGDSIDGANRFDRFRLAQQVLKAVDYTNSAMILFDEIEDVFSASGSNCSFRTSKAWVNQLLEQSSVPTFWVSNKISQIDPAYIRRFDLVVEMKCPPKAVRKKIMKNVLKDVPVSAGLIRELSEYETLMPGVLNRAGKFIAGAVSDENEIATDKIFVDVLNRTLKAQKKSEIMISQRNVTLPYSLDYVNTTDDLVGILDGVKRVGEGRLLLYGLPGTGKTAFGKHLADQLNKPLVLKKASDLLSCYIGEAEKNIAAAFKEAIAEDAVLMIDEVDSFLRNRQSAVRTWEISEVNEFLTQLEAHSGVFIASSNLIDELDPASMRRFDFKIEFKPMANKQAMSLLKSIVNQNGGTLGDYKNIENKLLQLENLTPGDFAAVERKFKIGGQKFETEAFVDALENECSFKKHVPSRVGFC